MKIRKLKIRNYKIFDDVEFDFTDAEGNTLDTIVLAGVNGCGKTTVLEVIDKFFNHKFTTEFDQSEIEIEAEITLTKAEWDPALLDEMLEKRHVKFDVSHAGFFDLHNTLIRGMRIHSAGVYFPIKVEGHMNSNFEYLKISEISRDLKDAKSKWLKIARDEVFGNKNLPPKNAIENQIQNLTITLSDLELNTRLVDIESEELVFESANGQRIYFEQLSHGEQHLYFRAIYLSQLNLKDSIIMVDEPEAAFHPTWQQKIAQLYRNVGENNQVIMATHSPHIMASVPPECLFMLHIDESVGKRKIRVINAAKAGKHSQGLEPDRILKEIMQVKTMEHWI